MNPSQINEEVLCILKHAENTNKVKLGYVEIEKDLEPEFNGLLNLFQRNTSTAKSIVQFVKNHSKLKVLFESYDYCAQLNRPYQGLYSTAEVIETNYPSNFDEIKDFEKKEEAKQQEKNRLLNECKQRLHANYLKKAYDKCNQDKEILAYSHRRVGWSAPKYPLNESFSIELKTNFGYGSVSYFYTKIKYKDLDIVPFSDWVNYQISKIYEIVQYSSKYRLNNESWQDAMEYVAEACNVSLTDEKLFIQRYIVEQCDEMIQGLRNILTNNKFKLKGYAFLNQKRGYVDLELDEHNLTEFRGEKISGALGLIPPIEQFIHIIEIEKYIKEIENCNVEVKPLLVEEQGNVKKILIKLNSEKNILEPQYNKLKAKSQIFQNKRAILKNELYKKNGIHDEAKLDEEFNHQNPDFEKFKQEFSEIAKEYQQKILDIALYEKTLENLIKYEKDINEYFEKKRKTGQNIKA